MSNPATYNAIGQPIYELDHTEKMRTAWLRDLEYPRDWKIIERLAPEDFKAWIYGLNPQQALILASYDKQIARIQARKRSWLMRFFDWEWRSRHGYR